VRNVVGELLTRREGEVGEKTMRREVDREAEQGRLDQINTGIELCEDLWNTAV
jgi:hypothetical protein